jgi:hypothetical protein
LKVSTSLDFFANQQDMTATFLERSMSTVELPGSGGTNSSEPNQQLVPFSLRVAHNGKLNNDWQFFIKQ